MFKILSTQSTLVQVFMAKLMFLPPIKIDRFEVLINQIYYVSKSRNRLEIGTCRKSRKGVGTHVFFTKGVDLWMGRARQI